MSPMLRQFGASYKSSRIRRIRLKTLQLTLGCFAALRQRNSLCYCNFCSGDVRRRDMFFPREAWEQGVAGPVRRLGTLDLLPGPWIVGRNQPGRERLFLGNSPSSGLFAANLGRQKDGLTLFKEAIPKRLFR